MEYIEIENKFYILASSSLADSRTMVLKQGETFGVFDRHGDITPLGLEGSYGIYHEGTRFLSGMNLTIEGQRPLLLSSNLREENELLTVDLTNPDYRNRHGDRELRDVVHILRSRFLWEGVCYERIRFSNFDRDSHQFSVRLVFEADFADIFEVRGIRRDKKGEILPVSHQQDSLTLSYQGLDNISRRTRITFEPAPQSMENKEVQYTISLDVKQEFDIYIAMAFENGDRRPTIIGYDAAHEEMNNLLSKLKNFSAVISTANESFNEWIERSMADLNTMVTQTDKGAYPYAGVPWYSTPFGRDGIITAFMCLWINPEVSKGVLHYLAETQAKELNAFQDAEPGKILHEKRGGEMAELGEVPFKQYYGTIDATPLFISLAGAYLERTNDLETIKELLPHIEKALEWIDQYGDLDGDGYVEYQVKSEIGLTNQGWKDSFDSIFYEDGQLAESPIALCEVQGYVYDAKLSAARIAEALGQKDRVRQLEAEAEELKDRFTRDFWDEEKQTYILALDGKKQPCRVLSSNAGHTLFSGIASPEHAEKMAKVLVSKKMFSGWGVRTIATDEARYNPMSYHNGSIWPHDNALIAFGLSRYGFQQEVSKIASGILDTALSVDMNRLPELFCGFDRRKGEGPTAYPVACSPQAWAVASVFILIQAMLGLKIIARDNLLYFKNPTLPSYIEDMTIKHLRINDFDVALQVRNYKGEATITLLNHENEVRIEIERD